MKESFIWSFPGGAPALALVLCIAIALVIFGYSRTWRPLISPARWLLTALRGLMILILLLCLTSPRSVMTRHVTHDLQQPIAVLVDSSGSMVRQDSVGMTRLALAKRSLERFWKPDQMKLFTFSDHLNPLNSPSDLDHFSDPERETHLLGNLSNILQAAPPGGWGAVLTFTDGNDSTEDDVEATGKLYQSTGTPLFLVATETDLHSADFIHISRANLAPVNIVNTLFPLDVFIQSTLSNPEKIGIQVLQNQIKIEDQQFTITPGPHSQRISFNFTPTSVGEQDYEIRVSASEKPELKDSYFVSTQIVERPKLPVLYYAGSLSPEYRFICRTFTEDPAIHVESLLYFSPNENRDQVSLGDTTKIQDGKFPESVDVLNEFSAVILADLNPSQLNPLQTAALLQYVKGGGGLIFMISNNEAANAFAGSDLEQLLPTLFPHKAPVDMGKANDDEAERLKEQLAKTDDSDPTAPPLDQSHLYQMAITPDGREILGQLGDTPEENAPLFNDYATISQAKPGSIVVANFSPNQNGDKQPMLVLQHFGEGRSAVLATDSLWCWQMALPSTSQAYKKIWQQLLFWVANEQGDQPDVITPHSLVKRGDQVPIQIKFRSQVHLDSSVQPTLTLNSPDKPPENVPLFQGADDHVYNATVNASSAPWMRLQAQLPNGPIGMTTLNVRDVLLGPEDEHLTPDLSLLQRLAKAAGGQVIDADGVNPGSIVTNAIAENDVIESKTTDLWDNPFVFVLLILLFGVELVLRRWQKLL